MRIKSLPNKNAEILLSLYGHFLLLAHYTLLLLLDCEAVQSAILATAWLLVQVAVLDGRTGGHPLDGRRAIKCISHVRRRCAVDRK